MEFGGELLLNISLIQIICNEYLNLFLLFPEIDDILAQ